MMPELPDITIYIEALEQRIVGHTLHRIRISNPFLVRSVDPPVSDAEGKRVTVIRRAGKCIALGFENDLWIVIHLMIAGRFRWLTAGAKIPGKLGLAAFDFDNGSLILTEAGSTRRASLHVVSGEGALREIDRGGGERLECSADEFTARLVSENHTLKRALTDATLFSGIGNTYSDEILHRARLSPLRLTSRLTTGPVCSTPVQRIRYASNETNYCPRCQTGGRLLADRGLSRLLKQDWPRSIDELY
jgi:formamidopyrimidine-DNA glycosylase